MNRIRFLMFIFSLLVAHAAQADMIDDLARNAEILSAKISPQGDYLGVLRENDGKRSVVIFTFPDMKLSAVLAHPGEDEVGTFWWVNDDRILASVSQYSDRWEAAGSTGELVGMNADGTKTQYLFGYRAGDFKRSGRTKQKVKTQYASAFILDRLPDDPKRVLVTVNNWSRTGSGHVEAALLNVYNGKQSDIVRAPAPGARLVADQNGQIRFGFHTDEHQNLVIYLRDPDSGEWDEFSKTPYGTAQIMPIAILDNSSSSSSLLVSHSPDEGPYGIYTMNPEDGSLSKVYRHDYVDAEITRDRNGTPFGV